MTIYDPMYLIDFFNFCKKSNGSFNMYSNIATRNFIEEEYIKCNKYFIPDIDLDLNTLNKDIKNRYIINDLYLYNYQYGEEGIKPTFRLYLVDNVKLDLDTLTNILYKSYLHIVLENKVTPILYKFIPDSKSTYGACIFFRSVLEQILKEINTQYEIKDNTIKIIDCNKEELNRLYIQNTLINQYYKFLYKMINIFGFKSLDPDNHNDDELVSYIAAASYNIFYQNYSNNQLLEDNIDDIITHINLNLLTFNKTYEEEKLKFIYQKCFDIKQKSKTLIKVQNKYKNVDMPYWMNYYYKKKEVLFND